MAKSLSIHANAHEGPNLVTYNVSLPDGRSVNLFVNRETRLVVVDIIDADDKGGVEILRRTIK